MFEFQLDCHCRVSSKILATNAFWFNSLIAETMLNSADVQAKSTGDFSHGNYRVDWEFSAWLDSRFTSGRSEFP